MKPYDPYAATHKLDDTSLEVIVMRLEARGKHPRFARMLKDYLDAMQIDTAQTVLGHRVWHWHRGARNRGPPRLFRACAWD